MIVKKYQTNDEWLEDRPGRLTGSKLHSTISERGGRKMGFYQLIADRIADGSNGLESDRERGHELEVEAVTVLGQQLGLTFETDLVMWQRDDDPLIAFSPDGYTKDLKDSAEAKCLGTARHIQIIDDNRVPPEYHKQCLQAFVVNEQLERHHFISYDPRVTAKPFHIISYDRKDYEMDIAYYLDEERSILADVKQMIEKLTF